MLPGLEISEKKIPELVLSFLVTSKARRRLLERFWAEGASGSCTEVARQAGVAFATAYRELQAMKDLDLVVTSRDGAAETYRANDRHPDADVLRRLVSRRPPARPAAETADQVRGWLRRLGAPLADGPSVAPPPSEEDALADAVKLAHRDAAVARVLPLCLGYRRDHLDFTRLAARARRDREKHALGFFLDLTTTLSKDAASPSQPSSSGTTAFAAPTTSFPGRRSRLAPVRKPIGTRLRSRAAGATG